MESGYRDDNPSKEGTVALRSIFLRAMTSIVMLVAIPVSGWCGFENGGHLFEECSEPVGTMLHGACIGYLAAIADTLIEGNEINGYRACIPADTRRQDLADIFMKHMQNNPLTVNFSAAGLLAHALADAFPCTN